LLEQTAFISNLNMEAVMYLHNIKFPQLTSKLISIMMSYKAHSNVKE
jgi:hypothetical protein